MKKLLAMMLALAMVLSLAACGGSTSSTDDGSTETAATESTAAESTAAESTAAEGGESAEGGLTGTLKIGAIGPLTGAAAVYGTSAAGGEQIAVDEINALGTGLTIELNSQDDEHDAEKSVNAYNTLKDWGAQVIAGCVTSTPCAAVATEAYADRMFMLTPSASSTSVTAGKDNMFQVCFTDPGQGQTAAQYIYDNQLAENIAVIYNNSDAYSTGIYQAFQETADELGLNVVSVTTFPSDDNADFKVQLQDAMDAGADFVFLPIYYTPASNILTQAAAMGYAPTFFGSDGMDGILGVEGFDISLSEGVMLMTPFAASDPEVADFVSAYESAYSSTPTQFSADGYDTVYAIFNALTYYAEQNGGLDVTDMSYSDLCEILISAFTDAGFSNDGLTGAGMTWSASGEVSKDPLVYVIQDGAYSKCD
jgi:branched-chain amino acid transport system substrate-binding protein